jgi:hypothetical protein
MLLQNQNNAFVPFIYFGRRFSSPVNSTVLKFVTLVANFSSRIFTH